MKTAMLLDLLIVFAVSAAVFADYLAWPWALIVCLQLLRVQIAGHGLRYWRGQFELQKTYNARRVREDLEAAHRQRKQRL